MIIWSTRGRSWGHRFLRSGGSSDPLVIRDRAFAGADEEAEVCHRRGATLALRFEDPEGRQDAAGRPIRHELIVDGPEADGVTSLEDGVAMYWPKLAEEYALVWDQPTPPDTEI
jgi:hypothetical protein